jgi:hypothetical protein
MSQINFRKSGFPVLLALAFGLSLSAANWAVARASLKLAKHQINAGSGTSGTATLTATTAATTVVKFSSSNTAVATVPSSMPVPPGGSQATVPIIAGTPGCTMIIASYNGQTSPEYLAVNPVPATSSFTLTIPDGVLPAPGNFTGRIALANQFATARVTLTSSIPAALAVPPTVETVRGIANFRISTSYGEGCIKITATIGSQSVSKYVQVIVLGG